MKLERKLDKYTAKANWYKSSKNKLIGRNKLPTEWKGSQPTQFRVPNMEFTMLLQVPSSKNGILLREIAKIEPRIAKTTGCAPCANPHTIGPSFYTQKSIVYEVVCEICDQKHKNCDHTIHRGRYIGQSLLSLYERANEHLKGLGRFDYSNFLFKYWATVHSD